MLRRAGVLAMVCALIPLPVAAQSTPAAKAGPIRASIEKIGTGHAPQMRSTREAAARRSAQTDSGREGSFFRSKTGMLALAVMIVGTGYAVYSTQNDRIKSPAKE